MVKKQAKKSVKKQVLTKQEKVVNLHLALVGIVAIAAIVFMILFTMKLLI